MQTPQWEQDIKLWLYLTWLSSTAESSNDDFVLRCVESLMQKNYPGPYTLDWIPDTTSGSRQLWPTFEDSAAATFWYLKYSAGICTSV